MWAYKSYNPNAPDPEEPSDAKDPQASPSAPRHFSFRSLLGRYREPARRARLAHQVVGLLTPSSPNAPLAEDPPSESGRTRRVSFSSQASHGSGKSGSSRRPSLSSRFDRFMDGNSQSRSELMLTEIMELLTEMKDDIRKANEQRNDEEEHDSPSNFSAHDFKPGNGNSGDNQPKRTSPFDMQSRLEEHSVGKKSSAVKNAAIAGSKEYARHKLSGLQGNRNNMSPKEASIIAAVESLAETLGTDVRPADIVSELPSLEHLGSDGLQQLLKAYEKESRNRKTVQGSSSAGSNAEASTPSTKPGRVSEKFVSAEAKNSNIKDKHDWDMVSPPQAFDWPTQEEIDLDNVANERYDRLEPSGNRPKSSRGVAKIQNTSATKKGEVSVDRRTRQREVQLPSPGASTVNSDFDGAANATDPDPGFDIVFPSTPLHHPGEKLPLSPITTVHAKESKLPLFDGERVARSQPSDRKTSNPNPSAATATADQVTALFHKRTSTLMEGCLAMLKDLGMNLHRTPSKSSVYEEMVLQWLGTWFALNCSAHERAAELFRRGSPDDYLYLHEVLTRLTALIEHPHTVRSVWDEHTRNATVQLGSDLKRAFLGVATGAVLTYLQTTLWSLSSTITDIIKMAQARHASNRLDPSLVLEMIPKVRSALLRITAERLQNPSSAEARDEAAGLLNILFSLATDALSPPPDAPSNDEAIKGIKQPSDAPDMGCPDDLPEANSLTRTSRSESPTLGYKSPGLPTLENEDPGDIRSQNHGSGRAPGDTQQSPGQSIKGHQAARQAQTLPLLMTAQLGAESQPPVGGSSAQLSRSLDHSLDTSSNSADTYIFPENETSSVGKFVSQPEKLNTALLMKKLEGVKGRSSRSATKLRAGSKDATGESRTKDPVSIGRMEEIQLAPRQSSSVKKEDSYFPESAATDPPTARSSTGDKLPLVTSRSSAMHMPLKGSPLKTVMSPPVSVSNQPGPEIPHSNQIGDSTSEDSRHKSDAPETVAETLERPTMGEVRVSSAVASDEPLNLANKAFDTSENEISADPDLENEIVIPRIDSLGETQALQDEIEAAASDAIETAQQESTQEPIASNQIMSSADILAGRLPSSQSLSDEVAPSETEDTDTPVALTQAEKDFMEDEIQEENFDALVPAPKVITSRDITKRRYNYSDFPRTLRSAVPRVETHPGAISSATTGEIVPLADEQIHLDAGETLVDGTGRTWNKEGVVEPGKDLDGRFLVYDVDLNQVKKTYGSIPAILPWETYVPETPSETLLTPSYQTGDDWSGDEMSEMSLAPSGLSTPAVQRGARASRAEEAAIDRQLMLNDRLDFIEEDDDDDVPLDDIDLRALEEEQEKGETPTPLGTPMPGQTTSGLNTPR